MATRNPNLDPLPQHPQVQRRPPVTLVSKAFQEWFTGIPPPRCPGLGSDGTLGSLPPPNLASCSRTEVQAYLDNTWTLTEVLFSSLSSPDVFYRPPYHGLRHPLIFYYGHPAVLYVNKLRVAGLLDAPLNPYFESIFETGVDEMSWDDMSKNEMEWPALAEVTAYRKQVYGLLARLVATHPDLAEGHAPITQKSPLWALFLGFEHERIHLETSSVLMRELPLSCLHKPREWPALRLHPGRERGRKGMAHFPDNPLVPLAGGMVRIGKESQTPYFGWDNEYGRREAEVPATRVSRFLVSNGEFHRFVSTGGYSTREYWDDAGWSWRTFRNVKWPTFWVPDGPQGSHEYRLRTIFEAIEMPWDWPAVVNYYEARAFCAWKSRQTGTKLRLITEAEHHLMRCAGPRPETANLNLASGAETSVDASLASPEALGDVFGNVWQWCEDTFHPLEGFEVHPFYDDFSTPCFDGRHQMIMGGSFVSTGDEASPWARFHFRPHFFQHAGFRMAEGEPTTAVRLPDATKPQLSESLGHRTASLIEKYLAELPRMDPMGLDFDPRTERTRSDFRPPLPQTPTLPETGCDPTGLLESVFRDMAPGPQKPGHPRYFAYLAGATDPLAVWAQAASMAINPYVAHHALAAACVEVEREVIHWFTQLFGLPPKAYGLLTTGSSLALLSALNAARFSRLEPGQEARARIYVSQEGHHAVAKALAMAGFPQESLTLIPVREHRMDLEALQARIAQDEKLGLRPFLLVGTAGTTATGHVDDLAGMARIAHSRNLWFHVDAAYGGPFQMTEFGKEKLRGIENADSLNFDFHKSFSMPYGTGCLLVRDGATLRIPTAMQGSYMPPAWENDDAPLDPADLGPELSRDFRALRVWLPLKARGLAHYRQQLEEKRSLALFLHERLSAHPRLKVVAPDLTVVAFHCGPDTREVQRAINARGRVFLSGCSFDGQHFIRVCVLSHLATRRDVELCLEEIAAVLSDGPGRLA